MNDKPKPKYKAGDYLWINDKSLGWLAEHIIHIIRSNFNFITNKLMNEDTEILYEICLTNGTRVKNISESILFRDRKESRIASGLPVERPPAKFEEHSTVWLLNNEDEVPIEMKVIQHWAQAFSYDPCLYECLPYDEYVQIQKKRDQDKESFEGFKESNLFGEDELFKTRTSALENKNER